MDAKCNHEWFYGPGVLWRCYHCDCDSNQTESHTPVETRLALLGAKVGFLRNSIKSLYLKWLEVCEAGKEIHEP